MLKSINTFNKITSILFVTFLYSLTLQGPPITYKHDHLSMNSQHVTFTMMSGGGATMMLAAFISVLVVLTFIIVLHCYARRFLSQNYYNNNHRTRRGIPTSPHITGFLHNPLTMLTIITTASGDGDRQRPDSPNNKGLESSAISSIPQFVYRVDGEVPAAGLECIVCLSSFENEEKGRKLQMCDHSFHVECIDMWLHSHSTCPICRAPAVPAAKETIVVEDCTSTWSGSLEIV